MCLLIGLNGADFTTDEEINLKNNLRGTDFGIDIWKYIKIKTQTSYGLGIVDFMVNCGVTSYFDYSSSTQRN